MTTRLDDLMNPADGADDDAETSTAMRPPAGLQQPEAAGPADPGDLAPSINPADGAGGADEDDLFADEAFLPPPRTSRVTLALVALLLLVVGVLIGVQVDQLFGGS